MPKKSVKGVVSSTSIDVIAAAVAQEKADNMICAIQHGGGNVGSS